MLFRSDSAEEIQAEPSSVRWWNFAFWGPWNGSLAAFTIGLKKVVLKLGLDWMAPSHYSIRLELVTEMLPTAPAAPLEWAQGEEHLASSFGDRADRRDTATAAGSSERGIPQLSYSLLEEFLNEHTSLPAMHEDADGALSESDGSADEGGEGGAGAMS